MGVETRINTINDKKSESLSKMIEVPIFLFGVTYCVIVYLYNKRKKKKERIKSFMGYNYNEENKSYPVLFVSPLSNGKSTLINALVGRNVADTHRGIVKGQRVTAYRHTIDNHQVELIEIPSDTSKEVMKNTISSYQEGLVIFVTCCAFLVDEAEYINEIISIINQNNKIKLIFVYNADFYIEINDALERCERWELFLRSLGIDKLTIISVRKNEVVELNRQISYEILHR